MKASQRFNKVAVVGAGPAGLAAAIFLKQKGWDVEVFEKRAQIGPKLCGECVSAGAPPILEGLGVWDELKPQSRAVREFKIVAESEQELGLELVDRPAWTIPRQVLDPALLARAQALEIPVHMGAQVRPKELLYTHDWIVGADGRGSIVAREMRLAGRKTQPLERAAIQLTLSIGTRVKELGDQVQMVITSWGYVGINPLPGDDRVNVIAVLPRARLKRELQARDGSGEIQSPLKVFQRLVMGEGSTDRLRALFKRARIEPDSLMTLGQIAWIPKKISRSRVALVGDSAGFMDPFTGEGIFHALESARALAEHVGSPGIGAKGAESAPDAPDLRDRLIDELDRRIMRYAQWHRKTFAPELRFCWWLQKGIRIPGLAHHLMGSLAIQPRARRELAEVISDHRPVGDLMRPTWLVKALVPVIAKAADHIRRLDS